MNVKNWVKRNRKIIAMITMIGVLIFAGPFFINCLHATRPTATAWDASATLSYYGTIIAAVIAICGVYVTIQFSQKNYREDVRNQALPFIVIDVLKTKYYKQIYPADSNTVMDKEKPVDGNQEYKLNDYYCILENGTISYKSSLSKQQQELHDNGGGRWELIANGYAYRVMDYLCVPIEIENIGNGPAVKMRYGLNRKNANIHDKIYRVPITLKTSTPIILRIFSEDCSKDSGNLGEYELSFFYEDLYSNRYEQQFDITIEYDEEHHSPRVLVNMNSRQIFQED